MTLTIARRLWVTLCLLAVLVAGVVVAVVPTSRPDKWAVLAVLAILLALPVQRGLWARLPRGWWVFALAVVALVAPAVIARGFGRVDMLAFLFHADFGMAGATLESLRTEILQGSTACLLILAAGLLLQSLWRLPAWAAVAMAAGVLVLNPVVRFGVAYALVPPPESRLVADLVTPRLALGTGGPDLVVIYLEGTDRQFADPALWGDVYAPLTALEAEGTAFTAVGQITGTGWSLAGMVASQCGVPVLPRGLIYDNNFDRVDSFMPGLTCLGDVLTDRGYRTSYVVGGDLAFGGIGTFYATHGFADRLGMEEFRAATPPEDFARALAAWVLDDQFVFDAARARLPSLMEGDAPFALVVETIGPHGATGWLSRRCTPDGQAVKSKDVAAVLACTIGDAAAFVADVRAAHAAARPDGDLRIVILSDHLSHNARAPLPAPAFRGANTAILLGGTPLGRIDRPGAMIDIYPTLLEWMGLAEAPVAAGLGRSLLGPVPTVLAAHGQDRLDRMILGDAALAKALWADAAPPTAPTDVAALAPAVPAP